jgi:hypothetical protein
MYVYFRAIVQVSLQHKMRAFIQHSVFFFFQITNGTFSNNETAQVSCAAASAGKGSRFSLHTSMLCSKYAPCA